jgi:hypothetical protein
MASLMIHLFSLPRSARRDIFWRASHGFGHL